MVKELLTPGKIGETTLKNRVIFPSMCNYYCDDKGFVTEQLKEYVKARARGGAAMIIMPGSPHGTPGPARPALSSPLYLDGWKSLAGICHSYGCRLFVQIHPANAQAERDPALLLPDNMEKDYILKLTESYTRCALAAKEAGLDGVELHGAHAHEIAQFLSPYYNHRTDEYGVDYLGRSKLYRDIVSSIKQACGREFPVICRISSSERIPGGQGRGIEETVKIAPLLEAAGADAIHVSIGMPLSEQYISAPMDVPDAFNRGEIACVKRAVRIPVIAVGRNNSQELAEELLRDGTADFTAVGRGLLADPDFVNKITAKEPICRCLGCNQGCRKSITKKAIFCVQNPFTGREASLHPTYEEGLENRRILIIGAGPAGLEAARIFAMRGARPVIWEKVHIPGGLINLAKQPPHKDAMERIISFRLEMLQKAGIPILLNQEAAPENISEFHPDLIILACGSSPSVPQIPGLCLPDGQPKENIYPADRLFRDPALRVKLQTDGLPVAVLGGGLIGTEAAETLSLLGLPVTVFELGSEIAKDLNKNRRYFVMERLRMGRVSLLTGVRVTNVCLPRVTCRKDGKELDFDGFGTILYALGRQNLSSRRLEENLKKAVPDVPILSIGDARQPGMAMDAIADAALTAANFHF